MSVVERRSVKINIPEFIEECIASHSSRDTDGLGELKEHFEKVYSKMSTPTKGATIAFIERYLIDHRIDHKRHLGEVFSNLNLKLK